MIFREVMAQNDVKNSLAVNQKTDKIVNLGPLNTFLVHDHGYRLVENSM